LIPRSPRTLFTAPPPTASYTLSLHDALPICEIAAGVAAFLDIEGDRVGSGVDALAHAARLEAEVVFHRLGQCALQRAQALGLDRDRKSTRLNSSHVKISYAVFCLKKKKKRQT